MGILDVLRPPVYRDPVAGNLVRRGRYWRGVVNLGSESGVPLLRVGPRAAPGETSLGLARELGHRYAALLPAIERALFEHYEPYSDAMESGERESVRDVPRLSRPEQVWGHVSLVRALIEALGGVDTVEIAYRTEWDTEHTVGARFQGWALTELNGSVV
ncbi:MAG: DUF6985 domain-containing protein [Candidatus Rokuibacteriota bacterium]